MVAARPKHLRSRIHRDALALFAPLCVVALAGGCAKVCDDDGFAWQQDPSCLNAATNTESASQTEPDSESDSESETQVPTTGGAGEAYCTDEDGDGFGDPTKCTDVPPGEDPPPGTVPNGDDCDDADGTTFPGAAPKDDPEACMKDADDDDYGDDDPPGDGGPNEPQPGTDCDDDNPNTFPGSAENEADPLACMNDDDGDGYGDSEDPDGPDGPGQPGTDCDDTDPDMSTDCIVCVDDDMDGWYSMCTDDMFPPGKEAVDCDDNDEHTFPGSAPLDDPDACMTDEDDDDYGDDTPSDPDAVPGTDCDDNDSTAFPGSAPLDDAVACMKDADDDDHGDADPENPDVTPGNDCNDANDSINPTDSRLVTAQVTTGEILGVDVGTGALTPNVTLDVSGFTPWLPTSLAVHPTTRAVYAALGFKSRLVTINYCGGGSPTALPEPHGRMNLCAIGFDKDGTLFGIDGVADELIVFAEDGSIASATELTYNGDTLNIGDCGMTWDCHQGRMLVSDTTSDAIYTIDTATAEATQIAALADDEIGNGLAYEPVTKEALSCAGTGLYSVAIDGSGNFTKLTDLMSDEPIDDLEFAPGCE